MNTSASTRGQLIATIKKLPAEALPELANFLTYLQFTASTGFCGFVENHLGKQKRADFAANSRDRQSHSRDGPGR